MDINILVLEASTSSAKAMVFNAARGILRQNTVAYSPQINDIATQKADGVVNAVLGLGAEVANGFRIDAVVPCSAWHSLLVLDGDMCPISPIYSWQYMGARHCVDRILKNKAAAGRLYLDTGCMPHSIYPVYKMAHLREEGLDTSDINVCGQGSYLFYKLTGSLSTTACMVSGSAFLNVLTKDYNAMSLELAGITAEQLPKIRDTGDYSPLNTESAQILGITAGIPVLVPNSDGALNQVGSNAGYGDMTISVGTSAALRMNVDSPSLHNTHSGTWLYLSPRSWMVGAATSGACNCVDWYMRNIAHGSCTYTVLEEIETNRRSLPYYLPFLFGERCPGWDDGRTAGFFDVKPSHTSADFFQSILEGVLFNIFQCYNCICPVAGEPKKILLSGGILHSAFWLQMAADIFGRTLTLDNTAQTSMVGAARLALETFAGITVESEKEKETIHPSSTYQQLYPERYENYMKLYQMNERKTVL